jgi:UDP-glucose 4-epimerase
MGSTAVSVLVTGGAGFIGSTVAHALADQGLTPIILDDLSSGSPDVIGDHELVIADIADRDAVDRICANHRIEAVIHCAAMKSVPESVAEPLLYYQQNVARTLTLIESLLRNDCSRFVFSSSASIYADGDGSGLAESAALRPSSPYARTKLMVEQALADIAATGALTTVALRYFNPIGADPRLRTGPQAGFGGTALGSLLTAHLTGAPFRLMGTDWPTPDGTAVRDYVHVQDVAEAHVATVRRLIDPARTATGPASSEINLGSGRGTSLRELVAAFETVTGEPVEVIESGRRPGDVAGGYALIDRAASALDWRPRYSLQDGIRDSLAWKSRIPI